jgi:hypothetical protein
MTKKEALEFLELPESASDSDIKTKIADKLSYFELLSEKSPSVFLRRIHEQNVAKVKLIQKESAQWSGSDESGHTPVITVHDESVKLEKPIGQLQEKPQPVTVHPQTMHAKEMEPVAAPLRGEMAVPKPEGVLEPKTPTKNELKPTSEPTYFADTVDWSKAQTKLKPGPDPVGWLVRHTENKTIKSFPVFPGKNFIGRKIQPGLKPFIQVEEDLFVSRVHAVLYAEGAGPYLFYISTYVNGSEDRINTKIMLHDYDTVQIGETKFVLRFEIEDILKMQDEVEDKGYMHTVIIKLRE